MVGRVGGWPIIGRAAARVAAENGWAAACTGWEPVRVLAGTTVAARRLAKLLIVVVRLIVV